MRLSNLAIFLVFAMAILPGMQGCNWWNGGASTSTSAIPEPKSRIPYSAREPDRFRAVVVVTTGEIVRRTAIAKDGNNLRIDFDLGSERSLRMLRTDKNYVISDRDEIYAEQPSGSAFQGEEFISDLTTRLLHRRENTEFESLGVENELAKYRVRVNDSSSSESIIYVDERIGMPVISEYYSVNGESRELTYRMELQEFSVEVDPSSFELPKDHRKVPAAEFYRIVRSVDR